MIGMDKAMERFVSNPSQTCTLTKLEFLQVGAAAVAEVLTRPEAKETLSCETRDLLVQFSAIYHTELEKMMFPSEETEPKSNDQ